MPFFNVEKTCRSADPAVYILRVGSGKQGGRADSAKCRVELVYSMNLQRVRLASGHSFPLKSNTS